MKYLERNKNINRGYRSLEVWIQAIELFKVVKQKSDSLNNVSYKIKAQLESSSLSVSSNIAEGYSRRHLREFIQFVSIALASLAECYSQFFALNHADIIEDEWFEKFDDTHYSLENKLINFNKSLISKLKQDYNWQDDYKLKEIIEKYDS